jgi:NAD(P)H-dependent flavin oxidoreductase YrpB (nitropropane dioxygenase family)
MVVAAGGISDGRGLAMALALGASAVWVGTRFVASEEADAPKRHKQGVLTAGYHDTLRTLVFSGRPMRIKKNAYVLEWQNERAEEMKRLLGKGQLPVTVDEARLTAMPPEERMELGLLMGQVAGAISEIKPAGKIMSEMMIDATHILRSNAALVSKL